MRRGIATLPLASAALASLGAAEAEEREMLTAFGEVLTAMAFAGAGLCLFSVVWAGFLLMAEGGSERGGGQARNAVVGAVVGLVVVLSAKTLSLVLRSGIVPIP